ncbi:ubiquitin-associated protein 1-like isoform X1 [Biomphalaria glabrata]|uniref:Ubiquitin-associated protein 1-like isoform X1 n=1 Tax=Biomphalaria glabrata TaxID=6526 RepID=A0A9U8EK08_BIOGL|nr:ubiquitin-associated protein 1-like isoform X1 [Biomphalaria glabrata]XP_055894652.1 ubiquitin-associated protein 1-like isoform X1 [Biomphalaria glabrata]XP_055894667.1 ubiquitin-associated protein 1-like isoform X1 [Biomphalaria glabrata]
MEERSYSSLSRHGLASSYSYLDGVPFKISVNFRQPPQVITLSEIMRSNVQTASNFDYNFEIEEGVLRWAQAKTEAAMKHAALQEQKEVKENPSVQSEQSIGDQSQEIREIDISMVPRDIPSKATQRPAVLPKPVLAAKSLTEAGTILKPIPIHPTVVKKSEQADTNSKFDVSMFESEADPFDNLELQTINDFEELKVVLDSSSRNSNPESTVQSDSPTKKEEESSSLYDLATVLPELVDSNVPENTSLVNTIEAENLVVNLVPETNVSEDRSPPSYPHEADESVEISSHHNGFVNGVHKSSSPTNWALTTSLVADSSSKLPSVGCNKLLKSVLPPISNSTNIASDDCKPCTEPLTQPTHPPTHIATSNSFNHTPANGVLGNADQSSNLSAEVSRLDKSQIPPAVAAKPLLKNRHSGVRMWSSVGPTTETSSLDDSSCTTQTITSPYSRYHMFTSDIELSKSTSDISQKCLNPLPLQTNPVSVPWNKHRPLPPPPSTSGHSKPLGLSDPYQSLSKADQQFVDSLITMGFQKARVSRAVAKFGQDEKEVLDHLLAVDQLVEKKFAPVFVESALQTFKNDMVKAEKFLSLLSLFEELGFSGDKIKEALIATDLDHDKSLDILTA